MRRGIDVKKKSNQTTALVLFWTYSYIRICVEPNDLAMSLKDTANFSATVSAHYLFSDKYQPFLRHGQIILLYTNSNAGIGPKQF